MLQSRNLGLSYLTGYSNTTSLQKLPVVI
uniref:Uncharacterized protein n=1 Tax=Anguilla anguilla TaxID=7936 RepID=A0A0E9QAK0_ANGAN